MKTISSLPGTVFRIKGVVDLSDPCQTVLFQYVGGRSDLSAFADSHVHDRFLTFIGKTECSNTSDDAEQLMQKIRFDLSNCLTPLH